MIEGKFDRREHEALFARFSAILRIAQHWTAEFRQMDSNLVFAAGVELDAEERKLSATFCHIESRDGLLPPARRVRGMNGAIGPFDEKTFDSSGRFFRGRGDDRVIKP